MKLLKAFLCLLIVTTWSCQKDNNRSVCDQQIDDLKINQLQYLASQNSYRMRTYEPVYDALDKGLGLFSKYKQPAGCDYTHETLEDQLNKHKIRGLEFDIYYDPDGGLFYHRAGNRLVGESTASSVSELNEPGFKILHQPDFDYMSHHYTFKSALEAVKNWSNANKNHLPLTILVEPKDDAYVSDTLFTSQAIAAAEVSSEGRVIAATDSQVEIILEPNVFNSLRATRQLVIEIQINTPAYPDLFEFNLRVHIDLTLIGDFNTWAR